MRPAQTISRRTRTAPERIRIRIRKNDTVKVIVGRDKGKTGRVLSVDRKKGTLLVEGVMMVKRHTRPNPSRQIKGGIAERESPIRASNVMLLTSDGKTTRIGFKVEQSGGKTRRVRIARRSGEVLEKKG